MASPSHAELGQLNMCSVDNELTGIAGPHQRRKQVTTARENTVKRYNLVLPEDLYDEVRRQAEEHGTTVVELLRKFIRLGLLAMDVQKDPKSALIIREGDTEKELILL